MRFLGILAGIFFLLYLMTLLFSGAEDFEDDLEYIVVEDVRFSGDAGVLVRNVSDQLLDRVEISYTIFPTSSSLEQQKRKGELPAEQQIAPGETVFLPFSRVSPNEHGEIHFRLEFISFREAPF